MQAGNKAAPKQAEVDTVKLLSGGRMATWYTDKGKAEVFIYYKQEGRSGALYWCVLVFCFGCNLVYARENVLSFSSLLWLSFPENRSLIRVFDSSTITNCFDCAISVLFSAVCLCCDRRN